jgi:hypothetical protein
MKVKDLKQLIDRLDPEAEVLATGDDLAQWHREVEDALPARTYKTGYLATVYSRRSKRGNAVMLYLGDATY